MQDSMVIQGRHLSPGDIQLIQRLLHENPSWHRTRLSRELCHLWNWQTPRGQHKDMACRNLLLKLEAAGHITLPPRIKPAHNSRRNHTITEVAHPTLPIDACLNELRPLRIETVCHRQQHALFNYLLARYHYLGYSGTVGENLKYLVLDRHDHPLACLLFGSAAWKATPRDAFIGWEAQTRKRHLHLLTNNMRFLILPWVRVTHLASHILAGVAKRISADWINKYGHAIYLLETFVERDRFHGTCYQAANWVYVGQTTGRTRNDRFSRIHVPLKDIYLYPLTKNFRRALTSLSGGLMS